MIQKFHIDPFQAKDFHTVNIKFSEEEKFPLLQFDLDTYITEIEIQSGLNFDKERRGHCLQLGKYNSLAEEITMLINLDHDYKGVTQGAATFLSDENIPYRINRKCQILIQNDVWIGHGATILGGVTIHNGAVVAANAVVTKDVPPYAIVAGNPAKIIKYRFEQDQIEKLLKIAWWNWNEEKLNKYKKDFVGDIQQFIDKHIKEAEADIENIPYFFLEKPEKQVALLIPDFKEPFCVFERILKNYFEKAYESIDLLIYFLPQYLNRKYVEKVSEILLVHEQKDCLVTLQTEQVQDIRTLFKSVDYCVTTRERNTILYSGYADLFNTKILSGVDTPIFRNL